MGCGSATEGSAIGSGAGGLEQGEFAFPCGEGLAGLVDGVFAEDEAEGGFG